MATSTHLKVVTPAGVLVETAVLSVKAKGLDGELEIFAHHAPIVVRMGEGPFRWTTPDGQHRELHLAAGFLRAEKNEITVAVKRRDGIA